MGPLVRQRCILPLLATSRLPDHVADTSAILLTTDIAIPGRGRDSRVCQNPLFPRAKSSPTLDTIVDKIIALKNVA